MNIINEKRFKMKTHTIKTPTAELMMVELQTKVINSSYHIQKTPKGILIKDDTGEKFISNKYTLLGKPDEIREEDAKELVERVMNGQHFQNYKGRKEKDFANLWCKTAKESLLSLLDTEIYWDVNPIKVHTWASENADIYHKQWHKAEKKTFDRNRTLIFVKN